MKYFEERIINTIEKNNVNHSLPNSNTDKILFFINGNFSLIFFNILFQPVTFNNDYTKNITRKHYFTIQQFRTMK